MTSIASKPLATGLESGDLARVSRNQLLIGACLCVGTLIHVLAYGSLKPPIAALLYYLIGIGLLRLMRACPHESRMFRTAFSVCYLTAGIAAVYADVLGDKGQLTSDAGNFYALSSGLARDLTVGQLSSISEGAGAIVLWKFIYDAFSLLGFEKARYIGIFVNVLTVALTGVFTIKTAKACFGDDPARLDRLILAFSFTGLFWLFASIHIRDAVSLLGVTVLLYFWTRYLSVPRLKNLVLLVSASLGGFAYFGLIRTEFAYIPLALLGAGIAASFLYSEAKGSRRALTYVMIFLGIAVAVTAYFALQSEMINQLQRAYESYRETSLESNSAGSLGNKLIVTAPLPVRLIFGSAYLFVFPIPFWLGFQLESAAHLFKSLNVLFFYATTPLLALSMLRIFQLKAWRRPPIMFQVFVLLGFTSSIALTSLETRHFGNFLVPFLVLLLVPDLGKRWELRSYRQLLIAFLSLLGLVHAAWVGLKIL